MTGPAPEPVRLAGMCGSLREGSLNAAVLATAVRLAAPDAVLTPHPGLDGLPYFRHDVEIAGPPPPVQALRALVGTADGVLITSPEFAHGTSGVLKNALEWLVGSGGVAGTPVAVVTASPALTGGDRAQAWLRETLAVMDAVLLPPCTIARAGARITGGAVTEAGALEDLRATVAALTAAARDHRAARTQADRG